MILPDANLLLYAYNTDSPFHAESAAWWSKCLSGSEPVALCPVVLFAFVRVGTHTRAFANPMSVGEATGHILEWLEQPVSRFVDMEKQDVEKALQLLATAGTGGNLTSDAQIAAIALRIGAVIHTVDTDFARFKNVKSLNPLTR